MTETWRRQIISGSPLERLAAVELCRSEGPDGWALLAELARDESLDLPVRVAATLGLTPPVPAELLHDVASALLRADDPVLRFRALVMAARFGLRRLRPHVEALADDPGTFWELDVEVSLAKVAHAAAKLLRAGKVDPNFPDCSAVAVDSEPVPDYGQAWRDVRASMFEYELHELGYTPETFPYPVFAIFMETALLEITFLLVCLADRTTSYYLSDGGWTVGGGHHESVQRAAAVFLAGAQHYYREASLITTFPPTEVGEVTFWFLTAEGVRRYAASEAELYEGNDPLTPLYDAGHAVLTALREIEETQAREGGDEQ